MKLIVDDQLPVALARAIVDAGYDCGHVTDVGLGGHGDGDIWKRACAEDRVVVTKDADFVRMQRSQNPPQGRVMWIRLGNCRKPVLLAAVVPQLAKAAAMFKRGEWVVEIR